MHTDNHLPFKEDKSGNTERAFPLTDYVIPPSNALRETRSNTITFRDANGRLIEWKQSVRDIVFGMPDDERMGFDSLQAIHPEDRDVVREKFLNILNLGSEESVEARFIPDGGSCFEWHMLHGRRIMIDGNPCVFAIGIDITERKQLEIEKEKLKESRAGLNAALDIRQIGFWELDLRSNKVHRTLTHDRIFGYKTLQPHWTYENFLDHIIPEERVMVDNLFCEAVTNLADWNIECRIRRHDGEVRWIWAVGGYQFDKEGRAHHMSGILQDITRRKLAEEERENLQIQLQHSQKMQLIGQLAGGIAHDFNNMLTVILGHTEIALDRADSSYGDLEAIRKAASHSAELTRQLLAFARRQTVTAQVIDLNASIEKMLAMLRRLIGENISLTWIPNSKNALVKLDPSQVDQILANLCINSRDAIDGDGNIIIETGTIHVDQSESSSGSPCTMPGDYVMLNITDNGHGIDKMHIPHVTEPFFTTKEVGKGIGMGLSTVYGIIKQCNGFMQVHSEMGKGTSMRIFLPLLQEKITAESIETKEQEFTSGKEIILMVEDHPDILQLCKRMLEKYGYVVLAATRPYEATRIAEQNKQEIDLLLTDVIMPEMTGSQLFKKLQAVYPNLKVLYMSGYSAEFIAHHIAVDEGVNFIEKPFLLNALTKAINKTLTNRPA